jgi:MoaA/NifB/PqqE/SkfB family radical SAM enzyme
VCIPSDPSKTIAAVFLLPACDMGCTFCASDLGFDRMGFGQACELIQGLWDAGYRILVLGGGEPALWRDGVKRLSDLGLFAQGLGFVVQVNTNGIRLGEGFESRSGIDRYIFPMDGASAARHDSLRVVLGPEPDGHFEVVQERVKACVRAGRSFSIGTVLTSKNLGELSDLIDWMRARVAEGAQIHAWHLYRFQAVGRGGKSAGAELAISSTNFRALCDRAKAAGLPFPVWRRDDMIRSTTVEYFWFQDGSLRVGTQEWGREPGSLPSTGS